MILHPRRPSFWQLQVGAWTLYALATAVSYIPFRHMREQVDYRVAFVCSTFLASFILRIYCRFLWRRSIPLASALVRTVGLSYLLGVLCTLLSAVIALHLAHDPDPLSWTMVISRAFEATIVLIAWSALYFGIKHYATVEEQRSKLLASEAVAREAQLQAREAQLRALSYQLQPHFLFNTLNAISSLVVSGQSELATEMISKLAALLRNTLSFPEANVVTLREELAVTEEYLSIEQIRFGRRLAVSQILSPEACEAEVPRFLLQPIVENAIRHGIARRPDGGEVEIRASAIGGQLRIEVENDQTESMMPLVDGHGLGLTNTRIRLETLYGERAQIAVSSTQNVRFLVTIQFPLTKASLTISQGTES